VGENLRFFGLLYGISSLKRRIEQLLAEFDLMHLRDTSAVFYPRRADPCRTRQGAHQRADLAAARRAHGVAGPLRRADHRERIVELASRDGCGILWTSHNMLEVSIGLRPSSSCRTARCSSRAIRSRCPNTWGRRAYEELFIRVAREPLDGDLS